MRVDIAEMQGVHLRSPQVNEDDRGTFVKLVDARLAVTQVCTSRTALRGTVRGLHLQVEPHLETKHLWCTHGRVFDVLVDTRRDEATFGSWAAVELDAGAPSLLSVPAGVAHGYQTLTDDVVVNYLIDGFHAPSCARTLRWDDPFLSVEWPLPVTRISASDRAAELWPVSL